MQHQLDQQNAYLQWLADRGLTIDDMRRGAVAPRPTAESKVWRVAFAVDRPSADGELLTPAERELLMKMARAMGLMPEEFSIVDARTCRRDRSCPDVIALGSDCLEGFAIKGVLAEVRRSWHRPAGDFEQRVLFTHHPSDLLATPQLKIEAWQDLQFAMEGLGLSPPTR